MESNQETGDANLRTVPPGGSPERGDGASTPSTAHAAQRAQLGRTLERAAAAMDASRDLHVRSLASLARADALVAISDSVRRQSAPDRAELRASVWAYAHTLRAEGLPPEAMIVEVKAAVRDATPVELDSLAARVLLADAVRWSIEAYYDAA